MDPDDDSSDGPLQDWARKFGIGEPTGIDIGGEGAGKVADAREIGIRPTRRTRPRTRPAARRSASTRARSPTARGRSATTSTSPSARATCRPTRCRWRSPTRRSRTAALPPRAARRSPGPPIRRGADDPGDRPVAPRERRHRPVLAPGDPRWPARRGDGAGRHLVPGVRRLPDRTSPARPVPRSAGPRRPVVVPRPGPVHDPKYVVAVTVEQGGFGVDTAAPSARISSTRCCTSRSRRSRAWALRGRYE